MDRRYVIVPYSCVLPYSLEDAYAWLTDYQDDDAERAGAILERRGVVERQDGRVVLDGTSRILGQRGPFRCEVTLFPPDRWEARVVKGVGRGSVYEYRLTRLGQDRTRLGVLYHIRVKGTARRIVLTLLAPLIQRELRRMWKGYAAAMARDFAEAPAPRVA